MPTHDPNVTCSRAPCGQPARWVEILIYIVTKARAPTARLCDGCVAKKRSVAVIVGENEAVAMELAARHTGGAERVEAVEPEDYEVVVVAWG
jgi:hypothetical protein